MALVKNPVLRAQNITTPLQAARLFQDLDAELALNDDAPMSWQLDAQTALDMLEKRFPDTDLRDHEETQGPKGGGYVPRLSRQANKNLSQGDKPAKPGAPAKTPAGPKTAARGGGRQPARRRSTAPRGRRTGSRRTPGRRLVRQATPSIVPDAGRFFVQSIGAAVALSLFYLLLRHPKAAETAAGGFAQSIARLVSPSADVFGGGAATTAKAPKPSYDDQYYAGLVAGPPAPTRTLARAPRRGAHPTPTRSPNQ